jgi:hypothetical protein
MLMSLPVPNLRFANNADRRNVNMCQHARLLAATARRGGLWSRIDRPAP